jgi:transposase
VQDIRSILRLTHQQGLSIRDVGLRLKLSKTTVATYLFRAREAGLNCWPLPPGRDDDATLERARCSSRWAARHGCTKNQTGARLRPS